MPPVFDRNKVHQVPEVPYKLSWLYSGNGDECSARGIPRRMLALRLLPRGLRARCHQF